MSRGLNGPRIPGTFEYFSLLPVDYNHSNGVRKFSVEINLPIAPGLFLDSGNAHVCYY